MSRIVLVCSAVVLSGCFGAHSNSAEDAAIREAPADASSIDDVSMRSDAAPAQSGDASPPGDDADGLDATSRVDASSRNDAGLAECRPAMPERVLVAENQFASEDVLVSVFDDDNSVCACQGALEWIESSPPEIRMHNCECCDACRCLGAPTSASARTRLPAGENDIDTPLGPMSIRLWDYAQCDTVALENARVSEVIGANLDSDDSIEVRVMWIRLQGTMQTCCAEPNLVVDSWTAGGALGLSTSSCVDSSCQCDEPVAREVDSWFPVVVAPNFEYSLQLNSEVIARVSVN